MASSVAGPALPHLREQAGSGIAASGFVLAGESFGYILGSLGGRTAVRPGAGHRLLLGAGAGGRPRPSRPVGGVASCGWWSPCSRSSASTRQPSMSAATRCRVEPTRDRVGSTLNALHLCFGIGALSRRCWCRRHWRGPTIWSLVAVVLAVVLARRRRAAARHPAAGASRGGAPPRRRAAPVSPAFVLLCAVLLPLRRRRGRLRRLGDHLWRRDPHRRRRCCRRADVGVLGRLRARAHRGRVADPSHAAGDHVDRRLRAVDRCVVRAGRGRRAARDRVDRDRR